MEHEKNPWETISSQLVYDNPWINVTEYQVISLQESQVFMAKFILKILRLASLHWMSKGILIW